MKGYVSVNTIIIITEKAHSLIWASLQHSPIMIAMLGI